MTVFNFRFGDQDGFSMLEILFVLALTSSFVTFVAWPAALNIYENNRIDRMRTSGQNALLMGQNVLREGCNELIDNMVIKLDENGGAQQGAFYVDGDAPNFHHDMTASSADIKSNAYLKTSLYNMTDTADAFEGYVVFIDMIEIGRAFGSLKADGTAAVGGHLFRIRAEVATPADYVDMSTDTLQNLFGVTGAGPQGAGRTMWWEARPTVRQPSLSSSSALGASRAITGVGGDHIANAGHGLCTF